MKVSNLMNQDYIFHTIFFFVSLILILFKEKIANSLKIMDNPDSIRKIHSEPIASIGGLIILPYLIGALIYQNYSASISLKQLMLWLFLLIFFFVIGFIDDRRHLGAKVKTFFLLTCLLIILPLDKNLVINALVFQDIKYIIVLNQASLFFSVFCIFFIYNALNFSDGLNGIAIGLCIYWIIAILIITGINNFFYVAIIISLFIILIPNLLNKIFIGNSGVNLLSILFALIFINLFNGNYILFDQIILLVFLPSIDLVRVVIERLLNNKSPAEPDQNHLHHLLLTVATARYTFIPYLAFAITPYLLNVIFFKSYIALIVSIVAYVIVLFYLKHKNV